MLSLRQAWEDRAETAEQRSALLQPWAEAIADESRTVQEAAALIAIAHEESGGFARDIVEGGCSKRRKLHASACDHGRARGPFQVHPWCTATGPAGETACAASAYRYSIQHCHDPLHAFGHYATGNTCTAMPARETTRLVVLRRLSHA